MTKKGLLLGTCFALALIVLSGFAYAKQVGSYSNKIDVTYSNGNLVFGANLCGDGQINDKSEQCDGSNLGGKTCSSLIFGSQGSLSCTSYCTWNTNQCFIPATTSDSGSVSSGGGGGGGSSSGGSSLTNISSTNGVSCIESWECTNWSACSDGNETRICADKNTCNSFLLKPAESRECVVGLDEKSDSSNLGGLSGITGAVVGTLGGAGMTGMIAFLIVIVVFAGVVYYKRRK